VLGCYIVVGFALLLLELLPKGKAIFPFFGILGDRPTMAKCEGLVVICLLEVLQQFEDLHSALNNGVMHRPKTRTKKQ
jgi:hypothetical protein